MLQLEPLLPLEPPLLLEAEVVHEFGFVLLVHLNPAQVVPLPRNLPLHDFEEPVPHTTRPKFEL